LTGVDARYRIALLDWLACAIGGANERASRSARKAADGLAGRVLAAATAGHALDFDDTYAPGLAHLSAPSAPAAVLVGAELGATLGDVLAAYSAGFEAMGALARASHPALYERGFHPTAVCGTVGAAVAAAQLLGKRSSDHLDAAVRLALVQAGGLRRAFGSDAKSLQVGAAAAAGVTAARLAAAGAGATHDLLSGPGGFEEAFGASYAGPDGTQAVEKNWIKAYPCCLQTHAAIEAAWAARDGLPAGGAPLTVRVHPRAREAAPYDGVVDGLQAKFSIPYTVAYTLVHGPPAEPADFRTLDDEACTLASERIRIRLDESLPENGAALEQEGRELARVDAATGSPARPMSEEQLARKVSLLGAERLVGALDDPAVPARDLVALAFPG
jgi:2-methylcitrate dehydratase PrpD